MARAYRKVPADLVERWRRARAEGATLGQIARETGYEYSPYLAQVCTGRARATAPGPIAPKLSRTLTRRERALVHEHVRTGLATPRLAGLQEAQPAAVTKERGRYRRWLDRLLSNVQKSCTPSGCDIWTGPVTQQIHGQLVSARPLFVSFTNCGYMNVARFLFTLRTGQKLLAGERLRPTCGSSMCVNPSHMSVIAIKGKERPMTDSKGSVAPSPSTLSGMAGNIQCM